MALADIIGHEAQVAYFGRVLEQKTVAHAYVLSGPRGVGKRAIAERLSAALLGIDKTRLASHPDVTVLTRPLDDKTGEAKRQIPLEHVRLACERLALSAVGGTKIVIIEDADSMTPQAQNALLKTLEEPSGQAVLFLLAEELDRLLPTIRSRAVSIPLRRVATHTIAAALKAGGYAERIADEAARRSYGRPGVALTLADADRLMETRHRQGEVQQFIDAPRHVRFATIATLVKGDDAKGFDSRERWIREICEELHERLLTRGQLSLGRGLRTALEARDALRENANTALALERIALALP